MKKISLLLLLGVFVIVLVAMGTPAGAGRSSRLSETSSPAVVMRTSSYALVGRPTISVRQIDHILCTAASPTCGTGADLYQLGVTSGIDPIYALAFFEHESTFGKYGMARLTRSLGNIRCSAEYVCLDGYRAYASWQAGYADWYRLIRVQYIGAWHLLTVAAIVRVYAPSSENNTQGYIAAIETSVSAWRAAA
ncbi:MAG: glucosaminidase domain-containing protein [Chloroflexota bacterium]|nr:glucosaminidase domain-containing protein [Chloroflexota bacterium]